ncbi:MAG: hypothetical protein RBT78_09985 [Kiritimatiellia bacterium]|jgi:hypothetical protein|nr:hypothetical protein [Kiritimatiellia bacterium]
MSRRQGEHTVRLPAAVPDRRHDGVTLAARVGCAWIVALALFSHLPGTFINYGHNYWSFLPPVWTAAGVGCAVSAILFMRFDALRVNPRRMAIACALLLPVCFWVFRTRIHVFCGDGAVGTIPERVVWDWLPRRWDGWVLNPLLSWLASRGVWDHAEVMVNLRKEQVGTVILGGLYVVAAVTLPLLRRVGWGTVALYLTGGWLFNCFGNVDCYPLTLVLGTIAFGMFASMYRAEETRIGILAGATLLCGLGAWNHPFFPVAGLPLAFFWAQWLRRFRPFRWIRPWMAVTAYGAVVVITLIVLLVLAKGPYAGRGAFPHRPLSGNTLIHLANHVLIPLAPLAVSLCCFANRGHMRSFLVMTGWGIAVFCLLPFTQGANDQFPYQLLTFFTALPLFVHLARYPLPKRVAGCLVVVNLFMLVPMIAVHSTDRTVARACAVYPLDPCKHNLEMSWSVHLGLLLGDNFQDNPVIREAALRIYREGAMRKDAFAGMNYLLYVSALYQYGRFDEGVRLLRDLLSRNPQLVSRFYAVRPNFIYFNRQRLWEDIERVFPIRDANTLRQLREARMQVEEQARRERYSVRRPAYAVTEL